MDINIRLDIQQDDEGLPKLVLTARQGAKSFKCDYGAGDITVASLFKELKADLNQEPIKESTVEVDISVERNNCAISKNDIVKCHSIMERELGAPSELEIGKLYHVLDIIKKNGVLLYYEVSNDDNPMRIVALPEEIEYVRTVPKQKKIMKMETLEPCSECGELVSLTLNADIYSGFCEKCMKQVVKVKA